MARSLALLLVIQAKTDRGLAVSAGVDISTVSMGGNGSRLSSVPNMLGRSIPEDYEQLDVKVIDTFAEGSPFPDAVSASEPVGRVDHQY